MDDRESLAALHRALDLGVNFFDTADVLDAEPLPNGGRINMGAYGGTAQASRSPFVQFTQTSQ